MSRFELSGDTLRTDLYENSELFGTIRMSGGWFTGEYYTLNGRRGIDVYATFDEALTAMTALPVAPTAEESATYMVGYLTARGYYDTEQR